MFIERQIIIVIAIIILLIIIIIIIMFRHRLMLGRIHEFLNAVWSNFVADIAILNYKIVFI